MRSAMKTGWIKSQTSEMDGLWRRGIFQKVLRPSLTPQDHVFTSRFHYKMMMIAFITIKSSLVPLIEGLCAQIYFRFEISVVCSHLLLFFFVKEKTC